VNNPRPCLVSSPRPFRPVRSRRGLSPFWRPAAACRCPALACRAYTLHTAEVASKHGALEWARDNLDPKWRPLLTQWQWLDVLPYRAVEAGEERAPEGVRAGDRDRREVAGQPPQLTPAGEPGVDRRALRVRAK
jgi:hypothetical protein